MEAFLGLMLLCYTCWAEDLLYDGFDDLAKMQREVREVTEVRRDPLFDNAPFLHLRDGDKLVKAKEVRREGKPTADPERISYYLFSAGKYYQLWTDEKATLELSAAFYSANACLLFDWEPTMANAQALRKLLPNEFAGSIPRERYDTIMQAVRRQFPELDYTIDTYQPAVKPDRLVSIPGHVAFEFEGISYASFSLRFHRYTIRIGPHDCQIAGQLLLQGPRPVDRWEFERVFDDGPNGFDSGDVDPKVAKVKKAEYDRMVQFDTLVMGFLFPKPAKAR